MKKKIQNWAEESKTRIGLLIVTDTTILVKIGKKNQFDDCRKEYEELKELIGWGVGDTKFYSKYVQFYFEK